MSAWVSPVCGLAYTMLSIFTASTRFSEFTGSPVNGDRSCGACAGRDDAGAFPQAASSAPAKPASVAAAATVLTALCLIRLIASSRAAHPRGCAPLGNTTLLAAKRAAQLNRRAGLANSPGGAQGPRR